MKDFRSSEAVFICEECGEELRVLSVEPDEEGEGTFIDLECRGCGPQGRILVTNE